MFLDSQGPYIGLSKILHLLYQISVCGYPVPFFYSSLPNYPINDLERVRKRASSISCSHLSYSESIAFLHRDSLFDHHSVLCCSLLSKILDHKEYELHHLLPPRHNPKYNFRQRRVFDLCYINLIAQKAVNFPHCNLINNNKNLYQAVYFIEYFFVSHKIFNFFLVFCFPFSVCSSCPLVYNVLVLSIYISIYLSIFLALRMAKTVVSRVKEKDLMRK